MDLVTRWNMFFEILGAKRRREQRFDPKIVFWFPELQFFVLINPGADARRFAEKLHTEEEFPVVVAWGLPGDRLTVSVSDSRDSGGGFSTWEDCDWCQNSEGQLAINTHDSSVDCFTTADWIPVKSVVKENDAFHCPLVDKAIQTARNG